MTALTDLTPAERHQAIAERFTEHARAVRNWQVPAPVEGWVASDIVSHLVDWFAEFLHAGGVELPSGPSVEKDPVAAWQVHCGGVQNLLDGDRADTEFSHPMAGTHRLSDAVDRFYTADVFMHTWDLATAVDREPDLDPAFAAHLLDGMTGIEDLLRSSGQYGPAVPVGANADAVTRLAGFIGRDPAWRSNR